MGTLSTFVLVLCLHGQCAVHSIADIPVTVCRSEAPLLAMQIMKQKHELDWKIKTMRCLQPGWDV